MKYRRLRPEELQELEQEFVRFLAANTVTAAEWEKLKAESPEKAEGLIDLFSDQVFQQVLESIAYLEYRAPKNLQIFQCGETGMEMVGLKVEGETELDLTRDQSPEEMMQLLRRSGAKLRLLHGEKAYGKAREQELFDLMEAGALIAKSGELFELLRSLKGE